MPSEFYMGLVLGNGESWDWVLQSGESWDWVLGNGVCSNAYSYHHTYNCDNLVCQATQNAHRKLHNSYLNVHVAYGISYTVYFKGIRSILPQRFGLTNIRYKSCFKLKTL